MRRLHRFAGVRRCHVIYTANRNLIGYFLVPTNLFFYFFLLFSEFLKYVPLEKFSLIIKWDGIHAHPSGPKTESNIWKSLCSVKSMTASLIQGDTSRRHTVSSFIQHSLACSPGVIHGWYLWQKIAVYLYTCLHSSASCSSTRFHPYC